MVNVMPDEPEPERTYLGDGLFAYFDGFQVVLAASDGIHDTNRVYLEPRVLGEFERYVAELRARLPGRI
jgi:hypothetical protein